MTGAMRIDALAAYEGLSLHVRRGMGERPGERRFPGRPQASGVELEAYRAYAPGEDLRHLDWNALARLDALLVRRFTAEREVAFHLLLDTSASMGVPPADDKLGVARELALALAYVALSSNDAVRIALLPETVSPVYRQRASVLRAAALLAGARAGGGLDLGTALAAYARREVLPGAAVVVSDLMTAPADVERGVLALRARGFDVVLLHVIGRGELEPDFGAGLLLDVESGATHAIALDAGVRARYRALLDAHLVALAALAVRTGTVYARLATGTDVRSFVTGELARLGVVRRR